MPILLRGMLVCDGCGKTIYTTGKPGAWQQIWWRLPVGWLITGDKDPKGVYCKYACIDKKYRASVRASQTGKPTVDVSSAYTAFSPSLLGTISEILDAPEQNAETVLAAIHALLDAFQKKPST